jgi:xanthine dehydrogenase accessory factor
MHEVLTALLEHLHQQHPAALCEVVETRGSTPQKPGATMLVRQDGTQTGTLGGGCVEAEVRRRALGLLAEQDAKPQLYTFALDSDYGWDDGLICGGRMTILVTPFGDGTSAGEYFPTVVEALRSGQGCVETLALADAGQPPLGSRYLFDRHGGLLAQWGPTWNPIPCEMAPTPQPTGWFLHRTPPRITLLIVGGGHVGQAVAALASQVDFAVWVVDDRESYLTPERFPTAARCLTGPIGPTLRQLIPDMDEYTYALIVTRGHNHDEEALFHLAPTGAGYVGMIGSKRKIRLIFEDLEAKGIPREKLNRVNAPVGLDIGSRTVPEIAISIVAEVIARRNLGTVPPRRSQGKQS